MSDDLGPYYEARAFITNAVIDDLMGPPGGHVLSERPLDSILVGVLHPQSLETPDSEDAVDERVYEESGELKAPGSEDVGSSEKAASLSYSHRPSSLGLSFSVDPVSTPMVKVFVGARRYLDDGEGRWVSHDFQSSEGIEIATGIARTIRLPLNASSVPGLILVGIIRPGRLGSVRITLSLVNEQQREPEDQKADNLCYFRPTLRVETPAGFFLDRSLESAAVTSTRPDEDSVSAAFLYRNEPIIAVGHGCAVTWDEGAGPVTRIETTQVPMHDLRLSDPSAGGADDPYGAYDLRMDRLADGDGREDLFGLVEAYERWIETRSAEAELLGSSYRDTGVEHLRRAKDCAERIRAGIDALDDPVIGRAFRLMNRSMLAQRDTQDAARQDSRSVQRWRPFQLAYILMNLPGLANPEHPDREVVDLLWFPTGGGKTEAYLGCIAFSILLRRLRRPGDGGVSAIMRYTLRLLTRQQFERAAGLICGLEHIRRLELPDAREISLGMWVGQGATPNDVPAATTILNKLRRGEDYRGATPVQVLRCPWCSAELGLDNYAVDGGRLSIRCSSSFCEFSDGLPLYVVDSDIYRERPSLLIGTVDKFAMAAWRPEVADLLAVDGPDSSPDLIIQDELHLITGPLGTIVGLYESAIDLACSRGGRPKVLASTATIRRATEQIKDVFDRESVQFPPAGLDPSDNYFAREADPSTKGTRQYVGLMAPGVTQQTLLVRVYAAALQAAKDLPAPDEVKDAYWTLLGYFNSLRVLGSHYLQVLSDIPDRLELLARRNGVEQRLISQTPVELTSRVDQSQIPQAMSQLETSLPGDSPDVVLATNMISVGLDIDRLGLMVVAGQPQSTSEYVQSTSRVGRRRPGLVFVALNPQKPRDSSHFESFIPFHRAIYREVEATTATPFAPRARDRAAHSVLVAAVRMLVSGLRSGNAASELPVHREQVERLVEDLVARAIRISPGEAESYRKQLSKLVSKWSEAAHDEFVKEYGTIAVPGSKKRDGKLPLLSTAGVDESKPGSFPVHDPPWPTMTSLRDVDATTELFIKNVKTFRGDHGGG